MLHHKIVLFFRALVGHTLNIMQRRSGGGGQCSRESSPVENGHRKQPLGGQLCPGYSASVGSSSNGLICGCIKKSSPLGRAVNKLRFGARRAARGSQKGALGAYLAAFVFLVWCGMQASALLRGGAGAVSGEATAGGEQVPLPTPQLKSVVATSRGGGGAQAIAGYGEDDDGPTLAYGIMVYQRVGYSPQMTLDQFWRMFRALYDPANT